VRGNEGNMKKGKTISLTASINLKEGSDLAGVLEAMECILEHPDIESTEIEYETGGQMQKVFRSKQGEAPVDSGYFLKGRF
tara:strand:+ start:415 stop:657 length:243 start_codon:yes stop_codon:yes gene_type:complete